MRYVVSGVVGVIDIDTLACVPQLLSEVQLDVVIGIQQLV